MKFRFVEQVSMATKTKNNHKKQQQPRSNLETKCIEKPQFNQRINKIKRVEKNRQQHQEIVHSVRSNHDLLWGRDWSLQSTINEFLQRDTNGLQEFSFNKIPKNKPNFYPFPNLTHEQDTQWFSLSQAIYNCSPTLESNPQKRTNP